MKKKLPQLITSLLKFALLPTLLILGFQLGATAERQGVSPMEAFRSIAGQLASTNPEPIVETPAEATPSPVQEDTGLDYYTIQVASYRSDAPARSMRQTLMNDRIHSSILILDGMYHVVVGKFPTRKQADKTLDAIQKKGYIKAQIIGR